MITCRKCKRFAKLQGVHVNFFGDVKVVHVLCTTHGFTVGDYTDYEELDLDD